MDPFVTTGVLTGDPRNATAADGSAVRVADVDLSPDGVPATARLIELPGFVLPYQEGDRVVCLVNLGDGAAGIFAFPLFQSAPDNANDGSTRINARGSGDFYVLAASGKVKAGEAEGGSYEPVMAHPDASQDHTDLAAKVNEALAWIRTNAPLISAGIAAGGGSYTPTAIPADVTVTAGRAAKNLEAEV